MRRWPPEPRTGTMGHPPGTPMHATADAAASPIVAPGGLRRFHEEGFTAVRDLIPRAEALAGREAALRLARQRHRAATLREDGIFHQVINAGRADDELRGLTLHPRLLAAVRELSGQPMRLWHDQLFIK